MKASRGGIRGLLLAVAGLALSLAPARALQLVGGDINTTAPGSSFNAQSFSLALPWENVGLVNGLSAIYLGDVASNGTRWVLTGAHVAGSLPASANFGGTSYDTVAGSYFRLSNPDTSLTDLAMFRLDLAANPSGLSTLSLPASGLSNGQDLYYVGYGAGIKRWGFNDYEGSMTISYGFGPVATLVTDYDTGSSNPNEAQAIGGDSGGAAFLYNTSSNSWQLAGVILAVDTVNSPARTFSASIPFYRAEILATAPEPSSMLLLTMGLAALGCGTRRRR